MSSNIKILIVEDDPVTAETMISSLNALGYTSIVHCSNDSDLKHLKNLKAFDIALLDIGLRNSNSDGIDIGHYLNENNSSLKLIFTTSFSDRNTLVRSEKVVHDNFLIKPISERQLYVAIERALVNSKSVRTTKLADRIFLKGKAKYYERVFIGDILYMESDKVGTLIHTTNGIYFTYNNLGNLLSSIKSEMIVRVHRKFVVNIKCVHKISDSELELENGQFISIGPSFKRFVHQSFHRVSPRM